MGKDAAKTAWSVQDLSIPGEKPSNICFAASVTLQQVSMGTEIERLQKHARHLLGLALKHQKMLW